MRRLWQALPAALFGALISAPLLLYAIGFRSEPMGEYRKLAEAPDLIMLTDSDESFRSFFRQLALWHSDTFPTRPFWIRLRTQWLFSLFGQSDQVYVGQDGWMYYRNVIDEQLPMIEMRTAQEVDKSVDGFRRLSRLLSERGVHLFVLPVPLKNHFYPEFLPPEAAHVQRYSRFEEFMNRLADETGVDMIDVRPILSQAKSSGLPIFHKTDFHWTDPAAALVGRHLLQAMARSIGATYAVEQWKWDVVPWEGMSGGQARFLPLFVPPTETTVALQDIQPDRALVKVPNGRVENQYRTDASSEAEMIPPVYIFGDSYFDGIIRAGFLSNFESSTNSRIYAQDLVGSFEGRSEGTRFAVIEFISVAWPSVDSEVERLIAQLEASPKPLPGKNRKVADGARAYARGGNSVP